MSIIRCAIYDNEFNALFYSDIFIQSNKVQREKKMMNHIVEDGTYRADHFTTEQIKITLPIKFFGVKAVEQYTRFKKAFNTNEKLIIQTDNDSFENMVLTGFPLEESPNQHMISIVNCDFQEFIEATPVYEPLPLKKVKKSKNASTKKSGKKQGEAKQADTAVKESALRSIVSGAKEGLKEMWG